MTLKLSTLSSEGIAVSEITGTPLTPQNSRAIIQALAVAYRVDYSGEEWRSFANMLYMQCVASGWTDERLSDTARWIAINKPWENLKLSDFFSAPVATLHPWSWVQEEVHKQRDAMQRMESYTVEGAFGNRLYRYCDGTTLPLPGHETYKREPEPEPVVTGEISEYTKQMIQSMLEKAPRLVKPEAETPVWESFDRKAWDESMIETKKLLDAARNEV